MRVNFVLQLNVNVNFNNFSRHSWQDPDSYWFGSSRIRIRKSWLRIRIRKKPDSRIRILKVNSRIRSTAKVDTPGSGPECGLLLTQRLDQNHHRAPSQHGVPLDPDPECDILTNANPLIRTTTAPPHRSWFASRIRIGKEIFTDPQYC